MSAKDGGNNDQDSQVEMWKVKKLIKSLQQARGYEFHFIFSFFSGLLTQFSSLGMEQV
jgi:hypothetical protein